MGIVFVVNQDHGLGTSIQLCYKVALDDSQSDMNVNENTWKRYLY